MAVVDKTRNLEDRENEGKLGDVKLEKIDNGCIKDKHLESEMDERSYRELRGPRFVPGNIVHWLFLHPAWIC